jgi:hypothetical protein
MRTCTKAHAKLDKSGDRGVPLVAVTSFAALQKHAIPLGIAYPARGKMR